MQTEEIKNFKYDFNKPETKYGLIGDMCRFMDIVYGHLNLNLEVKILNPYTLEINSSCMSNNVKSLGKFGTSWSVERVGVICRAFGIKFKMQGKGGGWVKGSLEVDTTLYPKLDRVRRANMIAEAKIMEIHNNSEEFVQDRIGRKLENDGEYQLQMVETQHLQNKADKLQAELNILRSRIATTNESQSTIKQGYISELEEEYASNTKPLIDTIENELGIELNKIRGEYA
jgi:hypothetical protein